MAQPGGHAPLQPDVTRANPPKISGAMTQGWNSTYNQLAPSLGVFTPRFGGFTQLLQMFPAGSTAGLAWDG